jgi:hypothetical protein
MYFAQNIIFPYIYGFFEANVLQGVHKRLRTLPSKCNLREIRTVTLNP